jgi:hypothetical protein
MEALGPVFLLLSIPLAFRLVPRNCFYGFRVASTLRDDAIWYEVNATSGRQLGLLGGAMVGLEFVLPLSIRNGTLTGIAILGLVMITVTNWRRANRLARTRGI